MYTNSDICLVTDKPSSTYVISSLPVTETLLYMDIYIHIYIYIYIYIFIYI